MVELSWRVPTARRADTWGLLLLFSLYLVCQPVGELASQAKHHAKDVAGYSIHVIDSMDALPQV